MGFSPIGVICTRMYVIVCASSSHAVVFDENFDHGLFFFQFVVKTMFCHFYDVQHDALDGCSLTFFFLAWCVSFPKWVQIFSRGREGGDRVAGTVWEQMGENRYVSAWKNR